MAEKKDEALGSVKQGIGKLTGDEGLDAEGKMQKSSGRAKRKASGAARQVKGKVKEAAGELIDSPSLEAEGKADKARGRVERA
jgi:uncharacterized protein YjbJ (UPF0337 family)